MSTNKKVLIGIGIALFVCICVSIAAVVSITTLGNKVADSFKTDPQEITAIASQIADYELPAGYSEQMATDLFIYKMLFIASTQDPTDSMIMLMQFEGDSVTQEDMEQQMQQAINQQFNQGGTTLTVIETRPVTIRGQEMTATISEGTNQNGDPMRQFMVPFEGKGGPAMLVIMGNSDNWDEGMIEDFIASMK